MEPLLFEPILKRIRWGGRKLGDLLHKPIGAATDYAESWEIADQPGGQSVVADGPFQGCELTQLLQNHGDALLGIQSQLDQFPLLIKFLDAHDWLSLQVHPNDQQAKRYDPSENGKTEAWVILDAEPDSMICAGLKSGVTRDSFRQHLEAGSIEQCLHLIGVNPGDCVFVPAQTVHALGPGILLAEVQQQSDLTFRLHDWGRLGSDGQPREIHIEQSLECIDFARGPVNPVQPLQNATATAAREVLICCEYFEIHRYRTDAPFVIDPVDRFHILMVLNGTVRMSTAASSRTLCKGTTVLIPATCGPVQMQPDEHVTVLDILRP